jgi:hypothetical protein
MPYKHPEIQSNSPYYDDFEDAKNFLKVLFKPGYAVQARELTQLQSILQSQISKFADHIFLDGSQVIGGKVNVSPANYVRVERFLSDEDGVLSSTTSDSYLSSLIRTQTSYDDDTLQTNQILGTVQKTQLEIYKYDSNTSTYATESSGTVLMLHYGASGYSATDNYTVLFFMPLTGLDDGIAVRDLLKVKDTNTYFKVINPTYDSGSGIYAVSPYGTANLISVDDGIFYLDGLFVKNYNQLLAPYYDSTNPDSSLTAFSEDGSLYDAAEAGVRLFTYPSVRVGLTANKTVVTAVDDTTLRDPSNGFYNSNAPGADRYTINLVLSQLTFDPQSIDVENYSNSDFIQLARMVEGKVDWIRRLTNYSEILEVFARRTYDESGSYTVRPFQMEVKNHYRNDYYEVIVQDQDANFLTNFTVGSYVYSQSGINPFSTGFDFTQYAVLEVLSIFPYQELNSEIGVNGFLVKLKSKSPKRVAFDINSSANNGYGELYYMKPGTSIARNLLLKLRSYNIDPTGTYSPQDLPVGDVSKMVLTMQPGKAYVYGYEYENYSSKNVDYLKKDNESLAQQDITVEASKLLGNYVIGYFAQDTTQAEIEWERLPKFKLNSDDLFVLIIEEGENLTAEAPIFSWSPYKLWTSDSTKYIQGISETNRKYESVIFVQDTV